MKVALKDKSALQAQVASLQKTNYDISRSKNILQERVILCLSVCEGGRGERGEEDGGGRRRRRRRVGEREGGGWKRGRKEDGGSGSLGWMGDGSTARFFSIHLYANVLTNVSFSRLLTPLMPGRPRLCSTSWKMHPSSLK